MRTTVSYLIAGSALAVGILAGACSATRSPEPTPSASAPSLSATVETPESSQAVVPETQVPIGDVEAVSASKPSAEALDVFTKCHIGDHDLVALARVTGMVKLASKNDVTHYVALSGREPQLAEAGPAWVVTMHIELPQPGSTEIWTDPTCVVTGN